MALSFTQTNDLKRIKRVEERGRIIETVEIVIDACNQELGELTLEADPVRERSLKAQLDIEKRKLKRLKHAQRRDKVCL